MSSPTARGCWQHRVQRKGRAGSRHIAAHRAADRGRDRRRRAQNSHRSPRAPGTRIEVQTEAREPREGGGASDSVESQPGCAPPSERPQHSLLLTPFFSARKRRRPKACRATVLQPARSHASPRARIGLEFRELRLTLTSRCVLPDHRTLTVKSLHVDDKPRNSVGGHVKMLLEMNLWRSSPQ